MAYRLSAKLVVSTCWSIVSSCVIYYEKYTPYIIVNNLDGGSRMLLLLPDLGGSTITFDIISSCERNLVIII
ncbi:hypothetical protein BDW42DRAFT_179448 [Aspergillus taichungensis]|uniref:Uncharacterized protein n=1 Tax=Aspergillus taichungensis TaxID=482145 RepID=A0A2J5HGK0_9EURO|nr:hypothetical protein BDW42DRAFT_179448 [Aspergillus taichungensis]